MLAGHEPYPAIAVDRHWTLVASNRAIAPLLAGIEPSLLQPPVNVIRLSLHPAGLAPRIVNLEEWRSHLLARLRRQIDASGDPVLQELFDEISNYPVPNRVKTRVAGNIDYAGVAIPLQFATEAGILSFISTTTIFGTPVDITLSELALETFFPADDITLETLTRLARADRQAAC